MSGASRLIGRSKEFNQMGNFLQMGPAIIVSGVKGVGKTYFVRQWLIEKQKKFKWYSLGNHLSLREVLGADDKSIELVLEDASKEWKNYDIIVWDGFQYLAPSTRALLLSFVLNSSINSGHVFIGDENYLPTIPSEVPVLRLNPLDDGEMGEYLKFIGLEFDNNKISEVRKKTAGLPLFINLLIQNRDIAQEFDKFKLSTLPKDSQRIIKFLSILGRPVEFNELTEALKIDIERIKEIVVSLKNQYLVEDIPGSEEKLAISSFVVQMCLSSIKVKERLETGRLVLEYLVKSNSTDRTLLLVHALKCEEHEMANNLVKTFNVDEWQQHLPQSLEEIKELLVKSVAASPGKFLYLSRSLLQIYFITGERAAGMAFGEELLNHLVNINPISAVEQEIVVDVVRQQNRCHEFGLAYENASKFLGRMKDPYQSHLYVEMAVSLLPTDAKRSAELLIRVINRDIAGTSFMLLDKLAKAHAHFQLARHYDNEKSYKLAQENYEKALIQYEKLGQPYFAQVTRLNLLWIKVNEKQWSGFDKNYSICNETSERYGYNYVLAGLDLLKSLELTDHIQFREALKKVEAALQRLPQKASRQALIDVLSQKVRVLNLLGRNNSAQEVLAQIRDILRGEASLSLRKKMKVLEIEINSHLHSSHEIMDEMEKAGIVLGEESNLQEILLARGHDVPNSWISYPLGNLRHQEYHLLRAISGDSGDSVPIIIQSTENFLARYPEAEIERIKLLMLKAKQISRLEQRTEMIHDLNMMIERSTRDAHEIKIYRALLENIESLKRISMEIPKGLSEVITTLGLIERSHADLKLTVIEQDRRRDMSELDITPNDRDVVVLEKTGDVYFKGHIKKEFSRRQTLRKLINLLIEVYPSFVSKQDLAMSLWAESYSPLIHDTRIYTSVKRVREIFDEADLIQSWSGGYRWNPRFSFALVKDAQLPVNGFMRIEALLVSAFQEFKNKGQNEVSRGELLQLVDSSEATVKRALSNLVERQLLERSGKGRSVTYRLAL